MQAIAKKIRIPKFNTKIAASTMKRIKICVIIVAAVIFIVAMCAYRASLQRANNSLQKENEYLQAEIDLMNNEIVEETKLSNVEKTATEKLGMVYANQNNVVTIKDGEKTESENLASVIMEEAYK